MYYLSVSIPIAPGESATTAELIERYSLAIRTVLSEHKIGKYDGWTTTQNPDTPGVVTEFSIGWQMRKLGAALERIQEALVAAGAPQGTCIVDDGDPVTMRDETIRWRPPKELFRIE